MRRIFRDIQRTGEKPQEILDYFSNRYGDEVLLSTPLKKETALLWVMPFMLLAIGIFVVILSFKRK